MAIASKPQTADEAGLTIEGVNHFTLPVRDHMKSRDFYVNLLGAEVRREPDWSSVRAGRARSAMMAIRMCEGCEIDLFWQPFGQGEMDRAYPHTAFFVQAPAELDAIRAGLDRTGVPTVLTTKQGNPQPGQPVTAELYFRDPDGNPLQVSCRSYPYRDGVEVGPFDQWRTAYLWRDWPKA